MKITAENMNFKTLNDEVRRTKDAVITIDKCIGQRYVAAASKGKKIIINGTPGNALGCYLDGSQVLVHGNTQEATGDTMNDGEIFVFGNSGDATGYAMRGGKIYIKGSSGYRTGIHMKAYMDKHPVIVIGETAGSFLGEYQAGGTIVVLNLTGAKSIVGNFCGTGMHGGKMFLRCRIKDLPKSMPKQVSARVAQKADLDEIHEELAAFCKAFSLKISEVLDHDFVVLTPDAKNPYKKLYTHC